MTKKQERKLLADVKQLQQQVSDLQKDMCMFRRPRGNIPALTLLGVAAGMLHCCCNNNPVVGNAFGMGLKTGL
jgi:hypothetical protein